MGFDCNMYIFLDSGKISPQTKNIQRQARSTFSPTVYDNSDNDVEVDSPLPVECSNNESELSEADSEFDTNVPEAIDSDPDYVAKGIKSEKRTTTKGESNCCCEICGKVLSTAKNLKIHSLLHSRSPNLKCDYCDKVLPINVLWISCTLYLSFSESESDIESVIFVCF